MVAIRQRFTAIITEPGRGRPLRAFRRQGRAQEGILRVLGFIYDVATHFRYLRALQPSTAMGSPAAQAGAAATILSMLPSIGAGA